MREYLKTHPVFTGCLVSCMSCLTLLVVLGSLLAVSLGWMFSKISNYANKTGENFVTIKGDEKTKDKLLVLPVSGVILDQESADPLESILIQATYAETFEEWIDMAINDKDINGIILKIDSPGGTITGSKAIGEAIQKYKSTTQKPVYAYVSGLAASGGYWVASSTDRILADAGSLTGSIGVIMGPFKYYNIVLSEDDETGSILTQNGINTFYITGGESKDLGNPYREMTEKEKSLLQEGVNEEYDGFVDYVSQNRNIFAETVKNKIGAYVYSNKKAKELGLIDEIKNYSESIDALAKKQGLTEYRVVSIEEPDFWTTLLGASLMKPTQQKCLLCNHMLMIYGDPKLYGLY